MDSFIRDFYYGNYANVQIKKKLDSLFSTNQIRENYGSASQSRASVRVSTMAWRDLTRQSHRALESSFRERQSFLKN